MKVRFRNSNHLPHQAAYISRGDTEMSRSRSLKFVLTSAATVILATIMVLAPASPGSAAPIATGDGTWEWVNPLPQGNTLRSTSFVDANTGWAVGLGGTVLKTTDGGTNWNPQIPAPNTCAGVTPYGSGCNLKGVSFFDANNGMVVGDYGTIWHTTNGGANWTAQAPPSPYTYSNLNSVDMTDATHAVAVGTDYVFYTSDGGATWIKSGTSFSGITLDNVQMINANTGWTVGSSGSIFMTGNGGVSWTAQTSPLALNEIRDVHFVDANNGVAVSGARLLRTTNGGVNWEANTSDLTAQLYSVSVSGNNLVISGASGTILRRSSATNWSDAIDTVASGLGTVSSGTTSSLWTIDFTTGTSTAVYAAGEGGVVTGSIDSGAGWGLKAGADSRTYSASSFINDTTGWVVSGEGTVIKTTTSGDSWTSDGTGIDAGANLRAVSFVNETTGWAGGYLGSSGDSGKLYKYSSGTWSNVSLPAGIKQIWGVHMSDATHGWAVGRPTTYGAGKAVALRTTDGNTWNLVNTGLGNNVDLYGVDATNDNAWAVGQDTVTHKGVAVRYNGSTWTTVEKTDSINLISVDMVDGVTGYASGYGAPVGTEFADGRVYKTTDGGASWNMSAGFPSTTPHLMAAISFADANNGFVTGGEGRTYKTGDGGASWTIESLGTGMRMSAISVIAGTPSGNVYPYKVYAAGDGASVLRSQGSYKVALDYLWTWYDNASSANWVLMANPYGSGHNLTFQLSIANAARDLSGYNNGIVGQGQTITPRYPGVIGGPVDAKSVTGEKGIVSQRILWAGNSLEEVPGTEATKLSSHFWWTWYDSTPGFTDWILVGNPSSTNTVYYQIKIGGAIAQQSAIAAGGQVTPVFSGAIGGPVEVAGCSVAFNVAGACTGAPMDLMASQRVLSNGGAAFNEVPGIPDGDLKSDYLWTWYDNIGGRNWVLIGNPATNADGSQNNTPIYYTISIAGTPVLSGGPIAAGAEVTPMLGSIQGGPVEVTTYTDPNNPAGTPQRSIASQRVVWGPSFEEVPGSPREYLATSLHWTWYDQAEGPGVKNWVLVGNPNAPGGATVYYQIKIAGAIRAQSSVAGGQQATPTFNGTLGGPVEVDGCTAAFNGAGVCTGTPTAIMASQRVLWNGFFNETLGMDLS